MSSHEITGYYTSNHASQTVPTQGSQYTPDAVCDHRKLLPRLLRESLLKSACLVAASTWKWPLTVIVRALEKKQHLHEISVFMLILLSRGTFEGGD